MSAPFDGELFDIALFDTGESLVNRTRRRRREKIVDYQLIIPKKGN